MIRNHRNKIGLSTRLGLVDRRVAYLASHACYHMSVTSTVDVRSATGLWNEDPDSPGYKSRPQHIN